MGRSVSCMSNAQDKHSNFNITNTNNRKGLSALSGKTGMAALLMVCGLFFMTNGLVAQTTDDLNPMEDAYIQDGSGFDNEVLYLEVSPSRKSYLLFDLSGISGTITNMDLILTVHVEAGTGGAVEVWQSADDAWDDDNLSNSNRPGEVSLIGTLNTPFGIDDVKTLNIPESNITANDRLSLVLIRTGATASEMAFASSGPDKPYFDLAQPSEFPILRVTYTNSSNVAVNSVSVNPSSLNLDVGNTGQLSASISPSNATNQTVSWASSDTAVATVNSSGLVTAVAAGSATITVTTQDGNKTDQATVTVQNSSGGPTGSYWTQTGSDLTYTTGDVGIGTAPHNGFMLSVAGDIVGEKVHVAAQNNWPDYVFADDYKLPSLEEVQQHIAEHGHLINIPSAAEVEANGIDLGAMNQRLLEKVEELTLYILQQDAKQRQLEARIAALQKQ